MCWACLLLTLSESSQEDDVDAEKLDDVCSTHLIDHRHKRTEPRHSPVPNHQRAVRTFRRQDVTPTMSDVSPTHTIAQRPHSTTPTSSPTSSRPREDVGEDVGVVECGLCAIVCVGETSAPHQRQSLDWVVKLTDMNQTRSYVRTRFNTSPYLRNHNYSGRSSSNH